MAEIVKRNKALSVSPLKSSQPVGASLAFLGINRAIPMMHGSQGCTAFGKVFFVRHFREPIPLQTSAMDQVSSVMGADDNIVEGLKTICEKSKPALVGVPTTGLSETQGTDVTGAVRTFRSKYPEYNDIKVIPVNTPDFTGCLETGYAAAVEATIKELVSNAEEAGTRPGRRKKQVNVLASSYLTPGDIETIKEIIESFGLRPCVLPDLSESLDGHMTEDNFSPVTIGGTPAIEFETLGDAAATVVIGPSLYKAADILKERTGVADYRFDHLMGLEATDDFILALTQISNNPVPEKLTRQRAQLQDAMLDTHFMIGMARVAIAADPDLLNAFGQLVKSMGGEIVAAVAPTRASILKHFPAETVKIGDLEDLEKLAMENNAELIVGNSHAAESAARLQLPLFRAGFPQYDLIGGYQRAWVGYKNTQQTLFDLANLMLANNQHEVEAYKSVYAQKPEYWATEDTLLAETPEETEHGAATAHAGH
ncbi:MAG: nitrogenase iron-molybdenum cofactor biosynthesis protein NifN [Gammaproteobacteria bacterium]|jgi:nitrogenase molybdenum-iron protein NifN